MRRKHLLPLMVLAVLLGAAPAYAANLLNNPKFDSPPETWHEVLTPGQSMTWTPGIDANDTTASAAVAFRSTSGSSQYGPSASECVRVTGGAAYDIAAKVWQPAGQAATGRAGVVVTYFPGSNCDGEVLGTARVDVAAGPAGGFVPIALRNSRAPSGAYSARVAIGIDRLASPGNFLAYFDDIYVGDAGSACVPDDTTLCLNGNRFSVTAIYQSPSQQQPAAAHMVQLTADSGYMWFFNPENIEAVVKVLNACGVNIRYWNFAGGLTNVKVLTTIRDMKSGASKTYTNPQGKAFEPLQDTDAFATCP